MSNSQAQPQNKSTPPPPSFHPTTRLKHHSSPRNAKINRPQSYIQIYQDFNINFIFFFQLPCNQKLNIYKPLNIHKNREFENKKIQRGQPPKKPSLHNLKKPYKKYKKPIPIHEPKFQKISNQTPTEMIPHFLLSPLPFISQLLNINDYKSTLPDFLLSFVDGIIRADRSQVLRYHFLYQGVDGLLRDELPKVDVLCLFYDYEGVNHIFVDGVKGEAGELAALPASHASYKRQHWQQITPEQQKQTKYIPNPYVSKHLTPSQLETYSTLQTISLDQIRTRCLANLYLDPQHILSDIFKVIAWNQLYRTKSSNSFIYLSLLLQSIIAMINRKKFHKKFTMCKNRDFQRLLACELRYKVAFENWPYVPDKFREYEEIDCYVPTPEKRAEFIQRRIRTKKVPVQCPEGCVCYADLGEGQGLGQEEGEFCRYTLKDGWVSRCPNRVNKIECNHQDEQKMKRCRNAEIKKCSRKKCRKSSTDTDPTNQIEECIMWGLDLYTRNIIYNSLPEVDLGAGWRTSCDNKENKNQFIQQSLLKAINFCGVQGYELRNACQYIVRTVEIGDGKEDGEKDRTHDDPTGKREQSRNSSANLYKWELQKILKTIPDYLSKPENSHSNSKAIFTLRDKFYAETLLRNYQYCYENISKEAYRIHTKGKGARCIKKQGIKQGSFIVEYYGQLYEPWRWYERQDFIKQVMKKKKLKNYIPEFYNIYLEHHKDDPQGYDLMVVDPNKKGNFSSRFSHSCNPNCGTVTTVSDGKYYIGMYSFRDIEYGEELTFDYCCMTESNYEHLHSICLCGTQRCRGNYLELANSRTFSQLVDKNTCFLSRNSLILQALQPVTEQDYKLCEIHNIKARMLADSPDWIKKWTANLLKYIEAQINMYKTELTQKWTKQYPWEPTTPEIQSSNIELYSQTSKNDLLVLRFQNLFTTVDKMKYFLNTIECTKPPLYFLEADQIVNFMIQNKESILKEIEEVMIQKLRERESYLIKMFMDRIAATRELELKLFYFRLCCLCISHMCLHITPTKKFNSHLLADIVYFYAFTHTYFTANEYKSHTSQQIKLTLMQITGKLSDAKISEKIKRRYSSQFVWGQLVSWYKQTIVNPQASLSQDRRGTLSYPMIKSTIDSRYPFERHCRKNFIRTLAEKSANSWPCAPEHGCLLSFRNPFKCYGTVFFQSVHNASKFEDFPSGNLLENVLNTINSPFEQKIRLFKQVQTKLSGIGDQDEVYDILTHIEAKYFSFKLPPPIVDQEPEPNIKGRKKKSKSDSSRQNQEE